MRKIIKQGQDARDALKKGIDLAADCIRVTLGPTGRNAVLGRMNLPPRITNDGVTIARNIEADDPIENQGVWIVKEATSIADLTAGDGTTTTAVLLQKIVDEVFNRLQDDGTVTSKKIDTIALSKEIDKACQEVVALLEKGKRKITKKDIHNVAIVAGEYPWVADLVTEVYEKIGAEGFVSLEEAAKTSYEVFKGLEVSAGYHSEYYVNNDKRECVLDNPYVLVTNQPFEIMAVVPVIEQMSRLEEASGIPQRNLVLIAPDFSKDVLNRLTTTKVKTDMNLVAVKLPQSTDDLYKDIAALTKAKFLDKNVFLKYEDYTKEFKLDNLGKVERAIIGDSYTRLVGGEGDTSVRVKELKDTLKKTDSIFDKDKLEKRIAYLSGGMAIIKVGGESDFEKEYFKLKVEDTINSVQSALKNGVVKGGGLALKEIASAIPTNILTPALNAPYNQIQENTGGIEIGEDIVDAYDTVVSSLKSACSLAGRVITTEVVTAFITESKEKNYGSED